MCNTREMEKKTQNAMVTLDGYLYFDVPNFQAANLTLRHTWTGTILQREDMTILTFNRMGSIKSFNLPGKKRIKIKN